jgi:hypothetical protein
VSIDSAVRYAVWLIPALSLALIVEIYAPRFGVKSPSLIDDWFALTYAPTAVHELLHGHYNSAIVDYGGRYRPTYALLADFQWSFGSRNSTFVPTLIGLGRLLFFAGATAAIAVCLLRSSASRTWLIVAASVVPVMVVAGHGVSYNFVRFGLAEPTALAAIAIGLAGMTAAARTVACGRNRNARRVGPIFGTSYLAYLFGAYMSEECAAIVVLLPALYYWISREPEFRKDRRSRVALVTTAVLLVAPIAHIFVEIAPGVTGDHHGSGTVSGLVTKLAKPVVETIIGLRKTGDLTWPILIALTFGASARRALRGDRLGVLFTGMMVSGFAAAYIAVLATSGNVLSRYYIPLTFATGLAFVWLLQSLEPTPRSVILAATMLVLLAGRGDLAARRWLQSDLAGDDAIVLASNAYATGCPVYLVDFPIERRMGLARMLNKRRPAPLNRCAAATGSPTTAFAVSWRLHPPTPRVYPSQCEARWQVLRRRGAVVLSRCNSYRQHGSLPTQDTLEPDRIARLDPPTHWINASDLNRLAYVDH